MEWQGQLVTWVKELSTLMMTSMECEWMRQAMEDNNNP